MPELSIGLYIYTETAYSYVRLLYYVYGLRHSHAVYVPVLTLLTALCSTLCYQKYKDVT
jgi:hypothetical protein